MFDKIYKQIEVFDWNRDFNAFTKDLCELLRNEVPHYNWIGFYWVNGAELILGEWSGPHATQHTRIPIEMGVCGFTATEGKTEVVQDVSKDKRYLACFTNTKSEIVTPILLNGETIGLIDIDSDKLEPFTDEDVKFLEHLAAEIAKYFSDK